DYFGGYPTIYYTEYGAGSGMSWAGYGGTGTGSSANDAYLIENERQLFALANNVNGGTNYANKYFKLTKNISLTQPFRSIGWYNTGTGANNYFAGTFDGQGYTISNLTITTASNGNNANYMGLFGYVYTGATIKNLNVAVTATGGSYVGGLAGYNMGTISNVMVSGTVSGSGSYIGGIVGVNSGTIKNAYNKATVNGTNSTFGLAVGNVVGINLSAGKMFNIIATGNTTASQYQWVGAMIGQNHGTLQNSFSTGNATGAYYVGGVAGQNGGGTLFNIYSRGTIKATNTYSGGVTGYNNGGTVKYCYYLKGATTAGSTTHNGIGSASTTVTADTANVTTSFTSTASGVGKSRIDILSSAGTLSTSMAVEGQAATTNLLDVLNFAQANLAASSKEYVAWGANSAYFSNYPTIYYTGWDAGSGTKWTGYGGDGDGSTAAKAYLIENEKHLLSLVNEVIAGQNQSGKFFKVAADITLTRDLTSIGMYVTSTSKSNSFNGTFDGQGYTIKGLNISATSNNQPNYMGLFGWNAGTVKNLFVEGNVSGGSYVGGI
ncbi:MAG: hypothetical protein IKK20_03430, partial [Clostridia bacterium]|nr:hypothetical protein [Clostridia bacterium]